MQKLLSMLLNARGAMSLGRVLVFLFGIEILVMTPYVLYIGKENAPYTMFLIFFAGLFCALIYNKTVDSKILNITVKDGEGK